MTTSFLVGATLILMLLCLAYLVTKGALGRQLRGLYFLRFQTLACLFLVFLPFVSQSETLSPLLGGLFVLERPVDLFIVVYLTFLNCWMLMATCLVMWAYGHVQMRTTIATPPNWLLRHRLVAFGLIALPMTLTVSALSSLAGSQKHLLILLGILASISTIALAAMLRTTLRRPDRAPDSLFFDDPVWIPRTMAQFDIVAALHLEKEVTALHARVSGVARLLGPAFVNVAGRLQPGYLALASFLLVVVVLYGFGYALLNPSISTVRMPALAYVLVILLLVSSSLAMAAFILDRLRIPVLLAMITITLVISILWGNDHYFVLTPMPNPPTPLTAAELLNARAHAPSNEMVIVAAAGGGIYSAMWTARVLAGLQEQFGPNFSRSIRLISGVSGGAVGAMYFVDGFTSHGPPSDASLRLIVNAAGASSLDALAWGIAYPDLMRLIAPPGLVGKIDRAWALEHAWRRRMQSPDARLWDWRADAASGLRPAVVFNATIAERGRRILLTPIDFGSATTGEMFHTYYQYADMTVVRAARLSASFPYVTPMARAAWSQEEKGAPLGTLSGHHFGDGGYYDNFGMTTIVEWLETVRRIPGVPRRVLIVRIDTSPPESGEEASGTGAAASWIWDTLGPALTLLNVRTPSQVERNKALLNQFIELWQRDGVEVTVARFAPVRGGPLSWHLTSKEHDAVENEWKAAVSAPAGDGIQVVRAWWCPKVEPGSKSAGTRLCDPTQHLTAKIAEVDERIAFPVGRDERQPTR